MRLKQQKIALPKVNIYAKNKREEINEIDLLKRKYFNSIGIKDKDSKDLAILRAKRDICIYALKKAFVFSEEFHSFFYYVFPKTPEGFKEAKTIMENLIKENTAKLAWSRVFSLTVDKVELLSK